MQLLIAIDGSHSSEQALRAVARRVWAPGTRARLVVVSSKPTAQEDFEHLFRDAVSILCRDAGEFVVEPIVLPIDGSVRDTILREAKRCLADWSLVGSRGQSMLENVLLGSVSQSIIERAKCPVLVAREVQPAAFGNILVGVDDSECAAAAVEWLSMQTWANNQTITLVSVVHDPKPDIDHKPVAKASDMIMTWQTERGLLHYALEYWASLLRERLPGATIHFGVLDGEARELLVKAANKWPAELVVLGSHARRGIKKLLLGSVSQNVAANANCSVEIVSGIASQHYAHVQALVEQKRNESPLYNEPSRQEFGSQVPNSPIVFFW